MRDPEGSNLGGCHDRESSKLTRLRTSSSETRSSELKSSGKATSNQTGGRGRGPAAEGAGSRKERAFLVGLETRTRSHRPAGSRSQNGPLTAAAQAARDSSMGIAAAKAPDIPDFSAEESLAELRSLAVSAGADIAGEFLQHRDRRTRPHWWDGQARIDCRRGFPFRPIHPFRSRSHRVATAQH